LSGSQNSGHELGTPSPWEGTLATVSNNTPVIIVAKMSFISTPPFVERS
jgi:hypothetical protein